MFLSSSKFLMMICLYLFASCLLAQSQSIPCGKSGTQSAMNECAAKEAKSADQRLNAVYRAMLSKLKSNKVATQKLIAAQRAWIAFRDADLAAMWPVGSGENANQLYGSVHPFCYYLALTEITEQRTKELQQRSVHLEGDVCDTEAKCQGPHSEGQSSNL